MKSKKILGLPIALFLIGLFAVGGVSAALLTNDTWIISLLLVICILFTVLIILGIFTVRMRL
jgi:hypothetical protein